MAMRKYYLHKRNGIFYAELVCQKTGLKLTARSTHTVNRDEALLVISDWLTNGIPMPRTNIGDRRGIATVFDLQGILTSIRKTEIDPVGAMSIVNALKERDLINVAAVPRSKTAKKLVPELLRFWDYEHSDYISDRKAHGHSVGKRHAYDMTSSVKVHWTKYFAARDLLTITRKDLKTFAADLLKNGMSAGRANKVLGAGLTAFSYWHREGIIPIDPGERFERFAGEKVKRGILTVAEAATLFARNWEDKASYVGNFVAATTGLRAGEVLAIRKSALCDTVLKVTHSWTGTELKRPKNGETRKVPLLPETRAVLLDLLRDTPHTNVDDPFVFWGKNAGAPRNDGKFLLDGLHHELNAMGIDWRGRNIVFHSHRHFYASRMADITTADKVRRVTGHKSLAVYECYADHITEENLGEMLVLEKKAFARILIA